MKSITSTGKTCQPRQRKQLMSQAHGKILDMACGTGLNFSMFPVTGEITAIDLSPRMLEIAQQKAAALNWNVQGKVMDAHRLEFADGSFDTVTSTLSTCTFPDPIQALREIKRVCRKEGLILLLEHVIAVYPGLQTIKTVTYSNTISRTRGAIGIKTHSNW